MIIQVFCKYNGAIVKLVEGGLIGLLKFNGSLTVHLSFMELVFILIIEEKRVVFKIKY
jgi:hypothetical protein